MSVPVPPVLGFGFCAGPEPEAAQRLLYRYLPPAFSSPEPANVAGALARAAAEGLLDPLGCEPLQFEDAQPLSSLPQAAWALFRGLPRYGELIRTDDGWQWTAFWNEEPVVRFAQPELEGVLLEALRTAPQHLWAQRHLANHLRSIGGIGDSSAAAMLMDPDPDSGLLAASADERVAVPVGLIKVVLFPASDKALEHSKAEFPTVVFGSLAVLSEANVRYEPLPLVRLEVPASGVPSLLAWAMRSGWIRGEEWAQPAILAWGDSDAPLIAAEEWGGRALAVLPVPHERLTVEAKREFERFLRSL